MYKLKKDSLKDQIGERLKQIENLEKKEAEMM